MDTSDAGYRAAIKRISDGNYDQDDVTRAVKASSNMGETARLAREALDKRNIDYRK